MSTKEFISAIKSREIIWNVNHRCFNNRIKKQELWEQIASEFNLPVEECKRKWKGLRATLCHSLKVKGKNLPPGSSKVTSKWKLAEDMSFLVPMIKKKSSFFARDKIFDGLSISGVGDDIEHSSSDPINVSTEDQRQSTADRNLISQLIEEVKQQQILWNENDPNFECKELKDEAWKEIESRLEISGESCRRKWKLLTDYLAEECAKHPDNRSSWVYFEQLDFVRQFIIQHNRNKSAINQNDSYQATSSTQPVVKKDFPDQVIAEVKKYPLLWNLYNKNYKSVYKKLKAWRKIANSLDSSVEDVKKKWKALRDIFARSYAKNPDVKSNNWPHFKQMIFLAPYLKGNKLSFAKSFDRSKESDDESHSSVAWDSENNIIKTETPTNDEKQFSNEDFIEAVRKKHILWDSNFNNFKNNKLKCVIWQEIADSFGTSILDCKKKWRTFRDLFVRTYLKPIREEDKSWKYYNQLKFLAPHIKQKKDNSFDSQINSSGFSVEDVKIETVTNPISIAEEVVQNDQEKNQQPADDFDVDKFILLVHQHNVLWDLSNRNYRNNEYRFQAWEKIAQHFPSSNLDDCRKRWKALRDNFSRNYFKPKKEEEKTWRYYQNLKFLVPHLKYKKCANVSVDQSIKIEIKEEVQEEAAEEEEHEHEEQQEQEKEEDDGLSSEPEMSPQDKAAKEAADKMCLDEFIDVVKEHEMLWNSNDENYRNNELRTKEWGVIAIHFNTSVEECKKKWKALRDSFVRNYFKNIKEKYKAWNYYDKMKFLGPHVKFKKGNNLVNESEFARRDDSFSSPLEDDTPLVPKKFTVKEFVNEIKKHTILWDLSDERCRMKKYRLQAWKEISAHFCVSSLECKRKWATLRSAFIREFAKCPDNDTWRNFKELDFLLPYLKANVSANKDLSVSETACSIKKETELQTSIESNEDIAEYQQTFSNSDENWTDTFIETVKRQTILWDTTDINFKNALKRQQAWNTIAKEFGLSIDDSKQKWKSLRDTFLSLYISAQGDDGETNQWKHYNSMAFLGPHLKIKTPGEIGYEPNNDSDSCSPQVLKSQSDQSTTNEKSTIKFIEAIKEKPLLWNWGLDDYKDKIKCDEAWEEIANKFGLSIDCCKERWLSLQNSYKRVIQNHSNGISNSWKYLEEMSFLSTFIDANTDLSNFVEVSGAISFDDIIEDYSFPEQPTESKDDGQDDALYEELFECSPSEFSQNIEKIEIPKHNTPDRFPVKRKKCSEASSDDDEEDREFFQNLKETMKQLPSDVKNDARGHIQAYLKVVASNHNLWDFNLD